MYEEIVKPIIFILGLMIPGTHLTIIQQLSKQILIGK